MANSKRLATETASHQDTKDCITAETYQDHNLQMRAALESRGALDVVQARAWAARHPEAWEGIKARACRMTRRDGKASMNALMGWARVEYGKAAPLDKNSAAALAYLLEVEFPDEVRFVHKGARCMGWY